MFEGCSSLTSLDLSHFRTSKVTDFSGMFKRCSSLAYLNIEYFKEFINALEIHKERTDNSNFKNMKKLFLENILKLKNED